MEQLDRLNIKEEDIPLADHISLSSKEGIDVIRASDMLLVLSKAEDDIWK